MIEEIWTPGELEHFLGLKSTILHIDVDWSIYAVRVRPVVHQLRDDIQSHTGLTSVFLRRIDMTEQESSPLWKVTLEWLKTNGAGDDALISGYGALLWIKDGRLSDSVIYPELEGREKLMLRTLKQFSTSE